MVFSFASCRCSQNYNDPEKKKKMKISFKKIRYNLYIIDIHELCITSKML